MAIVHLGAKRVQGIKSDRVSDSLGSSADGTNTGVTLDTTNEKLGTGAYSFDGSGDQVIFGSASDWAFLNSGEDFSLAFWCNPTATNASQQLFATMNDSSGANKGFAVSITSANKINIAVYPSAGGGYPFAHDVGTSVFEAGVWHHYALVYTKSDGKMRIYKDGSEIVEQAKGGTFTSGTPQFALMSGQRGDGGDRDYNGKLDDVGVYSRALSTTEITALYNSGTGALVSSLSSTAGLKAYYTMDSTSLTTLGTADFTEDFSETTPTAWAEDSSGGYENNLEPYKGSVNRLWFDLDRSDSVGVTGTFDLQNAGLLGANPSNTLWTFRFKINFTILSTPAGSMFIGLTDSNSAGANGACRFAGVRFKTTDGIRNISDNGGQALTASNRTDGGLASTITTGTDYYVTVSRHTANRLVTTVRSGSHTGTVTGEVTADTLETATDDLRYWKIQNHRASANSGQLKGYVYDLEFFNDSATTTGCKNDASTTSALDAYTNLPANTIFEQTDDTPKYYWKQSDGTWSVGA